MPEVRNKTPNQTTKPTGVQVKGVKPPEFKKAGFGGGNPNDPMASGSCKKYFASLSQEDQEAMLKAANGQELKLSWAYDSIDDMFEQLDKKSQEERDRLIAAWEAKVNRLQQQQPLGKKYGGMICYCAVPGCDIGHFVPLEAINSARARYFG